eukprot:352421-Chlamydomonas_euryale.AAC.78
MSTDGAPTAGRAGSCSLGTCTGLLCSDINPVSTSTLVGVRTAPGALVRGGRGGSGGLPALLAVVSTPSVCPTGECCPGTTSTAGPFANDRLSARRGPPLALVRGGGMPSPPP